MRTVAAGLMATAISLLACSPTTPIDDQAQPVVDALRAAEVPRQYRSTYVPESPSAYLACLQGVEEIEMTVDWDLGVVRLQPRRDAPAVFVTETTIVVDHQAAAVALPWSADLDADSLGDVFGTSLGAFIETGIRSPDPNATVEALIDIAVSVQLTQPPSGLVGDAIVITIDANQFNTASNRENGAPAPRFIATIDANGLVTGFLVSDPKADSGPDPVTSYAVVTEYEPAPTLGVPQAEQALSSIHDVAYPSAETSCRFEG